MATKITTINIDEELLEKAKKRGINISELCRNAIERELEKLSPINIIKLLEKKKKLEERLKDINEILENVVKEYGLRDIDELLERMNYFGSDNNGNDQ